MLGSSAANTAYKYSNGWQRWKTRAQFKLGVPVLPAVPLQVTLYLTELMEFAVLEAHSTSAMESSSCSIQRSHRQAGMHSPTTYSLVKGVVEGT